MFGARKLEVLSDPNLIDSVLICANLQHQNSPQRRSFKYVDQLLPPNRHV